jgi:DNA-binding transcriptional MerR regulator
MRLKIGELADATGAAASSIRYYEQIGLLPAPRRVSGQRRYDCADVRRVTFIRRCRNLDFPLEQIRALVALARDEQRSCLEAREIAGAQLRAVQDKVIALQALEREITRLIATADCNGGTGADCAVLDRLTRVGDTETAAFRNDG